MYLAGTYFLCPSQLALLSSSPAFKGDRAAMHVANSEMKHSIKQLVSLRQLRQFWPVAVPTGASNRLALA
jgi:hypothetical protein